MILRRTVHASPSALTIALALCTAVATSVNVAQAQTPPPSAPKPAPDAPAPTAPATTTQAPAAAPAPTPAPTATTTAAPTPPPATPPADVEPAPVAPAPAPTTAAPTSVPLWPEPSSDAAALRTQGEVRPKQASPGGAVNEEDRIYAEDWWSHARPILELHGYFRVRAQLFHKFGLGRLDPPNQAMWPRPADDYYEATGVRSDTRIPTGPSEACTESESGTGPSDAASSATHPCHANMQAGANLRFRLNPELHVSDNLRVMSQVDLLDNLVLGSTPGGYDNIPSPDGGYAVSARDGYAPLGFYDDTQNAPSAGRNSFKDSIRVKRAWAEYALPIGEVRFGRMPFHWGLGMMFNAGDGHDDDYQSTVDRIQVISGIKPLDLYFSAAWDFPNEGVTSDAAALPNPEPYDLAQLDDVSQYVFSVARRKSPQLERLALTRGELVLNAGFQFLYRQQTLSNDRTASTNADGIPSDTGSCRGMAQGLGCPVGYASTSQFVRRDAHAFIPDLWLQLKYKKFRFETEIATVQGSIANVDPDSNEAIAGAPEYDIRAWGFATEIEQKLVEDKLSLGFKFGWSSGDADVDGLAPGTGGTLAQYGDTTLETFRFHPTYRVDMILARHILTRQQGTYYFRPSADYDFLRDSQGQRVGGGLAAIWTRASEFMQAPGHDRDLGIELNGRVYYQSKDGALNDVPGFLGGFYTQIDYAVLFPMAGLGYPDGQATQIVNSRGAADAAETRIAQTLRWYMGVLF